MHSERFFDRDSAMARHLLKYLDELWRAGDEPESVLTASGLFAERVNECVGSMKVAFEYIDAYGAPKSAASNVAKVTLSGNLATYSLKRSRVLITHPILSKSIS